MNIFREKDIIYNEEIHSIAHKIELSRLIGRKVVGQLFGIDGSPFWWSYMWLNEGISTLFGLYTIDQVISHVYGNTSTEKRMYIQIKYK